MEGEDSLEGPEYPPSLALFWEASGDQNHMVASGLGRHCGPRQPHRWARGNPREGRPYTRHNNLLLRLNSTCHLARFVHLPRLFPLSLLEWKARAHIGADNRRPCFEAQGVKRLLFAVVERWRDPQLEAVLSEAAEILSITHPSFKPQARWPRGLPVDGCARVQGGAWCREPMGGPPSVCFFLPLNSLESTVICQDDITLEDSCVLSEAVFFKGEVFPLSAILVCQSQHQSLWNPYPRGSSIFLIHDIFGLSRFLWYPVRPRELTVQSLK